MASDDRKVEVSSWRRPAPRPLREVDPDEIRRAKSPFYSYNAELLSLWCDCSVKRATRFKNGTSKPTAAEMRLFQLYAGNRVLDGSAWEGWQVISRRGILVDPEGNEASPGLLRAYWIIVQLSRHAVYELKSRELIDAYESAMRLAAAARRR
jgi:hypothetical protein